MNKTTGEKQTVTVGASFSKERYEEIVDVAKQSEGVHSVSGIIRLAVYEYLDKCKNKKEA